MAGAAGASALRPATFRKQLSQIGGLLGDDCELGLQLLIPRRRCIGFRRLGREKLIEMFAGRGQLHGIARALGAAHDQFGAGLAQGIQPARQFGGRAIDTRQ